MPHLSMTTERWVLRHGTSAAVQKPRSQKSRPGAPGLVLMKSLQAARKPNFVLDDHSSRRPVTVTLQQPTRRFRHCTLRLGAPGRRAPAAPKRATGLPAYLVLLRVGFTMRPVLPGGPVRSYRTFSPLPVPCGFSPRILRRYFLCCTGRRLAFKRASRTLSGTLPCGVRTFLPRPTRSRAQPAAIVRPPARTSLLQVRVRTRTGQTTARTSAAAITNKTIKHE